MRWLVLYALALVLPASVSRAADPPAGQIVYTRKEGDRYLLHVMNPDGTGDRLIGGQTAGVHLFPTWSPDGKQIACMAGAMANGQAFQVALVNADGSGVRTLPLTQTFAGLPAWSPDGKQLAITAGDGRPNVYIADSFGNVIRQINPEGSGAAFGFWSRDGKLVGYTRLEEGQPKAEIVLAKADGTGEEVLTQTGMITAAGANAVSPDGKRLLFIALDPNARTASLRIWDFANKSETVVMDVPLPELRGPMSVPATGWAPDGKSFLVSMDTEKGIGIFRITEDGKQRTRLTPEGVDCFGPAWFAGASP